MTKRQYREVYLQSSHWQSLRKRVLELSGNSCQICGANDQLEVHHITYNNLYRERKDDLVCLCHDCHKAIHEYITAHRFYRRPPRKGEWHNYDMQNREWGDRYLFKQAVRNRKRILGLED